jgi:hypothetical protein
MREPALGRKNREALAAGSLAQPRPSLALIGRDD